MPTTYELPRSTPEKQGIASRAIMSFVSGLEERNVEMHGLVIVRHGHVVSEGWWSPYRSEYPHILNSISKSFTSMAVGFAVEEKRLSLNDEVSAYFSEEISDVARKNMSGVTIRHLLVMRTGHLKDPTRYDMNVGFLNDYPLLHFASEPKQAWVANIMKSPISDAPGTRFDYNNGASHLLSAIIHKVTGQTMSEYLQSRLFDPLGIDAPRWDKDPDGVTCGAWGLRLRTEDVARFGMLLLNKGIWNGRRILPESWVEQATSKQSDTPMNEAALEWSHGYGYQFWRGRNGTYRADGALGQYCIVIPDREAVVAINSNANDMQVVMDLLWEHLYSAIIRFQERWRLRSEYG